MNKSEITVKAEYFDLRAICKSGQVFRMYEREPGVFDVYSADRHVRIRECPACEDGAGAGTEACGGDAGAGTEAGEAADCYRPALLRFLCSADEFENYWRRYFDLDRDYAGIVRNALSDPETGSFIREACSVCGGIRILHQNIWEMMISFIISQQKQIPSIRKCIEALCERYGERRAAVSASHGSQSAGSPAAGSQAAGPAPDGSQAAGSLAAAGGQAAGWYTFPTPEAIAAGGPEGLKGLSLGYRERYIYETAVQYLDHGVSDECLEAMDYESAKKYLMTFTGIGEKVADCILLFGAGFTDAFPIDTHIKDILYREAVSHNMAGLPDRDHISMARYEELSHELFDRYAPNRGIVQQWMFAYETAR